MRPPSDHLLRSGSILLVRAAEPSAPVVDGLYRIYNAHADPVDSDSCFPDTTTVFGRPQDRERRRGEYALIREARVPLALTHRVFYPPVEEMGGQV